MQDALLTIILAVMILALALMGCLLLGKKAYRVRISAIALMVLVTFLLFLISASMALNYYGLLCTEALFAFAIPAWCLIAACLSWMEWFSPPPQWKARIYRDKSIFAGICLTIASIWLADLFLPQVAAIISDMTTGPSFEVGVVEQLTW